MRSKTQMTETPGTELVMEIKKHEVPFDFCKANQVKEMRALNILIKFIPIVRVG